MTKLTLLGGGNTVYIYPDATADATVAGLVAAQRAVLDVAFPADETIVTQTTADRLDAVAAQLRYAGVEVIDTRDGAT